MPKRPTLPPQPRFQGPAGTHRAPDDWTLPQPRYPHPANHRQTPVLRLGSLVLCWPSVCPVLGRGRRPPRRSCWVPTEVAAPMALAGWGQVMGPPVGLPGELVAPRGIRGQVWTQGLGLQNEAPPLPFGSAPPGWAFPDPGHLLSPQEARFTPGWACVHSGCWVPSAWPWASNSGFSEGAGALTTSGGGPCPQVPRSWPTHFLGLQDKGAPRPQGQKGEDPEG